MSDLDDNLKEILWRSKISEHDNQVAQIKQAFADAGYRLRVNVDTSGRIYAAVASGKVWYERFELEMKPFDNKGVTRKDVFEAAKRAAGLDTNQEESL